MLKLRSPQAIAIIGGGFSGAMVATHLLRHASHPLQIKLIERQSTLGQGIAYSTPFDCHLLNVPVGKMSAFPDLPNHFFDWLQNQPPSELKTDRPTMATFVSRKVYGTYIQAVLAEAQRSAAEGVQLEYLQDEAEAVYPSAEGASVHLKSGQVLVVDQVVLALGNFPPANPPIANRSFYQSSRYISNPWSSQALSKIDFDQPLLLIGSGLTMMDWAVTLDQQGFRHPIYVVSRRGLLPQSHRSTLPYALTLSETEFPQTVRSGMRWLRQEVKWAQQQESDWRAVIDALRPYTQAIWESLPLIEQKRFLRHVHPYWEVHRHRVSPNVAETLNQLLRSGQMQLQAGRVQTYQEHSKGVEVSIHLRQKRELLNLTVGTVINCTGAACNYSKFRHPLIANLLQHGFASPDPLALGLEVAANGALIQINGQASDYLFTLGSVQKGRLWETTAVPELRQQAAALAQVLLRLTHQVSDSESYQISRSKSFRYSNAL